MADYWKSQPRKFCEYCKCWIADNKPSIDFHERGKNHKENVAAKISEIKKKSQQKAKQEERMSKEFTKMEEAAMKAYQEDLKRMEREAAGLPSLERTPQPQPHLRPTVQTQPKVKAQPQPKGKQQHQKKGKANQRPREHRPVQVWVENQTDEGHTYYYNKMTGESQWEKPGGFQGGSSAPAMPPSSSASPWIEAFSPEGYKYYYNSETGESSWEKPGEFPSSQQPLPIQEHPVQDVESQEEPAAPQSEALSAAEESSSVEAPDPEEPGEQSSVQEMAFRKRKAEADPSEAEGDAKSSEDVSEDVTEAKKEDEVQSAPAEQKQEEVTQVKRRKAVNPYGSWEQVKVEKDPYASVDLQLPQVEESAPPPAPPELPPEPKQKFKERVITSLGDQSGPASFRKTKTQNGKTRSLRQREDD